jgi:hypothetical protein
MGIARANRHLEAGRLHESSAERHDEASRYWESLGDGARAEFERRNAQIERDAAQLERDRAEHEKQFPLETAIRSPGRTVRS